MVAAAEPSSSVDAWGWLCMLWSSSLALPKVKKVPSRPLPSPARFSGGDCGPAAAAWLLNEHGPALYQSRSPETCSTVRQALVQAWKQHLKTDSSGDESKAFVQQRLEQVPRALVGETLEQQVALTLNALLRGEEEIDAGHESDTVPEDADVPAVPEVESTERTEASDMRGLSEGSGQELHLYENGAASSVTALPYWLLPTDWARLSEAYQVDFVLHGLPGTDNCECSHCDCCGHVHVGPRSPGSDLALHVGWQGVPETAKGAAAALKDRSGAWGHWEPLGSGPVRAPLPRQQSTIHSDLDLSNALKDEHLKSEMVDPSRESDSTKSGWMLTGCSCPQTDASAQSPVCQQASTRKTCPKIKECCDSEKPLKRRVKDCCDSERPSSDDGGANQTNKLSKATIPTPSTESSGPGRGARFSVLLRGQDLFEGLDLEDKSPLRQADAAAGGSAGVAELERFKHTFLESVSAAAGINSSRVHILDIGLPFEEHLRLKAKRLNDAAAAAVSARPPVADKCPGIDSPPKEPDTGAGVLRFLTDGHEAPAADSALSPAPDATTTPGSSRSNESSPAVDTPPPTTAATPFNTPANDMLTPPRPDKPPSTDNCPDGATDGIETGTTVVRVLAILREPRATDLHSHSEPNAMMALELVVAELADPHSLLQRSLKNVFSGRAESILCPEAEGPRKASSSTAVDRARRGVAMGSIARLRHAKATEHVDRFLFREGGE